MFRPLTFRYRSICNGCGGSIQSGDKGERDGRINHCPKCTAIRARLKQEQMLIKMKVE